MKKLTAGIFTVLVGLVSANGANAAIATQGYVDQEVGKVSGTVSTLTQTVADNKTAAENDATAKASAAQAAAEATAAADATSKADAAEAAAKQYVDSEITKFSEKTFSATAGQVESNTQAIEGLLDSVEAMDTAYKAADTQIRTDFAAADTTLQGNIDNLSGTVSAMDAAYKLADTNLETSLKTYADGKAAAAQSAAEATAAADATSKANKALEDAKKYADEEDKKIEDTIGAVESGKTVVQMINEASTNAGTNLTNALKDYSTTTQMNTAIKDANDAQTSAITTAYEAADATTLSSAKTYAKDYADGLAGNYDAAGSAAAAQSAAIEAAKTETTTQVNALANGAVKTNTEAISAINNAENGILAQAKSYTNAEITALNLNELSRVPAECAEASKWCVLTSNGTNYYWEVIVRGTTDDAQPTGSVIPSMN